jgi:hypothetical protein
MEKLHVFFRKLNFSAMAAQTNSKSFVIRRHRWIKINQAARFGTGSLILCSTVLVSLPFTPAGDKQL